MEAPTDFPADYSRIQERVDLTDLHTFGVPWKSDYFLQVRELAHIRDAIGFSGANNVPIMILGGGSNILPAERFRGLVMHNQIVGRTVIDDNDQHIVIEVGAGENWHELVLFCLEHGYHGIENLVLIPGTVGGAVVQNIGAYDQVIASVVDSVQTVDMETGNEQDFSCDECEFEYRSSVFKRCDDFCVVSVRLVLQKEYTPVVTYQGLQEKLKELGDPTTQYLAKDVADAIMAIRRSKLPDWRVIGTAGSFFANPRVSWKQVRKLRKKYLDMPAYHTGIDDLHTVPAGWLIEHSSLDIALRREFLSDKHALVLANRYKGRSDQPQKYGKQIAHMAHKIKNIVKREFGVTLESEVLIV